MTSKQQKKKAAIRKAQTEAKTGSAYTTSLQLFRDERERWREAIRESEKNLRTNEILLKETQRLLHDSEKALRHEHKLREDIQAGAISAKESLVQIRELHQSHSAIFGVCRECDQSWPCLTIRAIREPEQATIASLQVIERELAEAERGDRRVRGLHAPSSGAFPKR